MTTIRFLFPSHTETHRLPGVWTRAELRERARDLGAVAWEDV